MNTILLASLEMKENYCPQHEEGTAETKKGRYSYGRKVGEYRVELQVKRNRSS